MKNIYSYVCIVCLFFVSIKAITTEVKSTVVPKVKLRVTRNDRPTSITSGPMDVISREQITYAGLTSLPQALQTLGGIQIQNLSGNDADALIGLRGFGANASSNTLLLLNGIPITNPDMQPPDLTVVPFAEIKSIEIISGSESVLYGDQAVGGAINILTSSQAENDSVLSCTGGSYDLKQCSLAFQHSFTHADLSMTAGKRHTNNYREQNRDDEATVSASANYFYQQGLWHLEFMGADDKMQYPGGLTAAQVAANRRQATNHTDFFNNQNGLLHINNLHHFNDTWEIQTDLVRRQMQGNGVLFSPFTQFRWSDFIKSQVNADLAKVHLTTGADLENDHYGLTTSFGPTRDILDKYSLFALATVPIAARWNVSMGFRAARQNSNLDDLPTAQNNGFASTLGATFQYTPQTKFYLRRAGSFRFPKVDENASAYPATNGLRTQHGAAYEGGVETSNERYSAKLGLYQLNLDNEIAYDPTQTPQFPFGTNTNFPPTVRRGFTVSGNYSVVPQVIVDGQYNHVLAQFESGVDKGQRIPLVSEDIFRIGIHDQFASYWDLYPEMLFTGNQFAANDDANVARKVGGHTIYNLSLRFHYQRFSASLRVNNIFNKYYYFYTAYIPSMLSEIFYPAPGRNISLMITMAL